MQLNKSGNIKTKSNLTKPVNIYYYLFKQTPNILISTANFNLEIYRRPKWVFTKYCIEYYIFSLNLTILFTVINLVNKHVYKSYRYMCIVFTKYIIIIIIYNYHIFNIIFKSCHILCITIFLNFKYKLI